MFFIVLGQHVSILIKSSSGPSKTIDPYYKYTFIWYVSQTQLTFIMFINVLGQHVSILIESSSGPSKTTDPYL